MLISFGINWVKLSSYDINLIFCLIDRFFRDTIPFITPTDVIKVPACFPSPLTFGVGQS